MLYIKLFVSLEFRCLLLSAFDTDVRLVVGIVDVLEIAMNVCSDVSSVVDRATDIAGDSLRACPQSHSCHQALLPCNIL